MNKIIGIDETLVNQITELRKEKNFQTIKKEIGEERLREFIHSIYPKFSITEIEKITGIPDSTLGYWFQQLKIPFIRNHVFNVSLPGSLSSEVVVSKGAVTKKVSTIDITPQLAYTIGFALGDGSTQKYQVEVFNKDKQLKYHLLNLLEQYGPITEENRENGLWRLRLSSVKIANLIKDEKGLRKDTVDYIFSNEELAKMFTAGFWDAEGSVLQGKNKYYHIYLYNSNEYILNKICSFMSSKSIGFSALNMKSRENAYLLNNRKVVAKKLIKRLSIPKSSMLIWAKEVGIYLNHTKKSRVVKDILRIFGGNQNE